MQLSEHTRKIHEQLAAASALGDERTQQIARALGETVESAARLAILDAVTATASDITAALFEAGGGAATPAITVHLVGDEVRVSVSHAPSGPSDQQAPRPDESDTSARISLRLPESLKADIERAAASSDVSVNTWLVRAALQAVNGDQGGWGGSHQHRPPWSGGWSGPGWSGPWGGPGGPGGHAGGSGPGGAKHVTGWVTG
ncbi:MAG TPA: toxin-antitoxin system HicB family antitoxin [Jatrophihabitans sp.]|jgi:hypothetical protein